MDAKQKFQRLQDLEKIRQFERLTGEDRARGGFKQSIPVHSDRPSRVQAWTPGMQVPVRPTFMGHETPAKAYAAKVRYEQWKQRKDRQHPTGRMAILHAQQETVMVALQAGLRAQLARLSSAQRAKHVANALFGTPITPPVTV